MNVNRSDVAHPTISEPLQQFLEEQRQRLKPHTFADYEAIIELFQDALICDVFGPDEILGNVDEFLGHFLAHKVIALQGLARWLREKGNV